MKTLASIVANSTNAMEKQYSQKTIQELDPRTSKMIEIFYQIAEKTSNRSRLFMAIADLCLRNFEQYEKELAHKDLKIKQLEKKLKDFKSQSSLF